MEGLPSTKQNRIWSRKKTSGRSGVREHNMIESEGLSPEKERKEKEIKDEYIHTHIYIYSCIYMYMDIYIFIYFYTHIFYLKMR